MSSKKIASAESITEVMKDGALVRLVTVIDISSMSILELLESGFTRQEVSRALSKGVIAYVAGAPHTEISREVFESDDYFFRMLNEKVGLTELGLYVLDCMKSGEQRRLNELAGHFNMSAFHPPGGPVL
jgi:hypothetical protein